VAAAIVAVLALTACGSSGATGSSSSDPQAILKQTFAGKHPVHSGVLAFTLKATPSGSSSLNTPLTLSLSGPFQSRGAKQVPASDFTVSIGALGKQASFGVISSGSAVYVKLEGTDYRLPTADAKQVQSSIASANSGAPGVSTFGIHPLRWLTSPRVVGTETVDGAQTTHIRAHVNVPALIADLNTVLARESKTTAATAKLPTRISAATAGKIAASIHNPTVDLWTGKSDSTLRRLTLNAAVPVTGQASTELGGMTSATITMTAGYSQLNQPQTISAPAHPSSYKAFQAKLQGLGQELQGALSGGAATGSTGSPGGSTANVSKYSQCIQSAGGDVTKMQKCASLLNGSAH
jgi:hypothetical protein